MNYATPQASVSFSGVRRGIFRYLYNKVLRSDSANTTQANASGRYTALYGTSFSNTAYSNDSAQADFVDPTVICFDPYSMEVYYLPATGDKVTVWNMKKAEADGQTAPTLDSFTSYDVSMKFVQIASGKTANAVIYSVNGQSLGGSPLTNDKGPRVVAEYNENVIRNEKVLLSSPLVFDVLGDETVQVNIAADVDGKSLDVYDVSGNKTNVYKEGCYVIPDEAGNMSITYTARDSKFSGDSFTATVKVFDTEPQISYSPYGVYEKTYGKGITLKIYGAKAESELFVTSPSVKVTVKRGDDVLAAYDDIADFVSYTFGEAGRYTII